MRQYIEDYVHSKGWTLGKAYSSYRGRVHIPSIVVMTKPLAVAKMLDNTDKTKILPRG